MRSNGEKSCLIWPRDKKRGNWGRIKDLMTGKGPDMYFGRSDHLAPTKAVWSNWTEPIFDDKFNYLGAPCKDKSAPRSKKYDFRTRRYVDDWENPRVWSDVKWEAGKNPVLPLYWRDAKGDSFSLRTGYLPAPWKNRGAAYSKANNDFRWGPDNRNWMHPRNEWFWDRFTEEP